MMMKPKQRITAVEQHPLAGSSFINLIKLFLWNGGIDREYLPQALLVVAASFLTIPLKIFVDKNSIPPENLIEIKYEDFIGNENEVASHVETIDHSSDPQIRINFL